MLAETAVPTVSPATILCPYCEGSGESYAGAPGDPAAYAGPCEACKGKGRVRRRNQSLEAQMAEADAIREAAQHGEWAA